MRRVVINGTSLLVTGVGIGWFAGLSVSPVASTIIASLLTAAVGIVTTLPEFRLVREANSDGSALWRNQSTIVPLAVITIGLVVGTTAGIFARTHEWLSQKQATAATHEPQTEETRSANIPYRAGVLFANVDPEQCESLRAASLRQALRAEMQQSEPRIRDFSKKIKDDTVLKIVLEDLICPISDTH